jgi:hypothetical protein
LRVRRVLAGFQKLETSHVYPSHLFPFACVLTVSDHVRWQTITIRFERLTAPTAINYNLFHCFSLLCVFGCSDVNRNTNTMSTYVYRLTVTHGWCIVHAMTRTRHNRNPERRKASRQHMAYDVVASNGYPVESCSVVSVQTSARYRLNRAMVEDSLHKVRDNAKPILNDTRERLNVESPQPLQHDITPSQRPVRASFNTPVMCDTHPQATVDKSTTYRECAVCEVLRKESPMRQ